MKYRKYSVTITGETPLLMHHDNIAWADTMKKWGKDPANKKISVAGDDRTPAWRWIGNLYSENGKICIPSDNLMTTLREGGAKCPTGNRGGTFKRQTQSGIVVDQSAWTLISSKGEISIKPIEELIENTDFEEHEQTVADLGFSLFIKRAKIGNQKHIRVRPRFDVWSCAGTMTVFDESITTEVFENVITYAGIYSGLCDWRPSSPKSPGSWGKFSAVVKEVK